MFRKYYKEIVSFLVYGTSWPGATDFEKSIIQKRSSKYKVINGVLYHKGKGRDVQDLRLVPTHHADQLNAIRMCHLSPNNVHYGINKTMSVLSARYYWRMMFTDVMKYIKLCPVCCQKDSEHLRFLHAQEKERENVWKLVEVELLENFHATRKTVIHVLRIVDVYSNWTNFIPLTDISEKSFVKAMLREFATTGFPLSIRFINCKIPGNILKILHEELVNFTLIHGSKNVGNYSVHVTMEELEETEWCCDSFLEQYQEVVDKHSASLYVFFGYSNRVASSSTQEWYLEKLNHFCNDYPYTWTTKLHYIMFSIQNSIPPDMKKSPFAIFYGRSGGLYHPEFTNEQFDQAELLSESFFTVEALKQSHALAVATIAPLVTKPKLHKKACLDTGISNPSTSGTAKSHHKQSSHSSSFKYSDDSPELNEEENDILKEMFPGDERGSKNVTKRMTYSKKDCDKSKHKSKHVSFCMDKPVEKSLIMNKLLSPPASVPLPEPTNRSFLSPTGSNRSIPSSGDLPLPTPGRYSFRQNLKAKGPSSFVHRFIAISSNKRGQNYLDCDLETPITPSPKRVRKGVTRLPAVNDKRSPLNALNTALYGAPQINVTLTQSPSSCSAALLRNALSELAGNRPNDESSTENTSKPTEECKKILPKTEALKDFDLGPERLFIAEDAPQNQCKDSDVLPDVVEDLSKFEEDVILDALNESNSALHINSVTDHFEKEGKTVLDLLDVSNTELLDENSYDKDSERTITSPVIEGINESSQSTLGTEVFDVKEDQKESVVRDEKFDANIRNATDIEIVPKNVAEAEDKITSTFVPEEKKANNDVENLEVQTPFVPSTSPLNEEEPSQITCSPLKLTSQTVRLPEKISTPPKLALPHKSIPPEKLPSPKSSVSPQKLPLSQNSPTVQKIKLFENSTPSHGKLASPKRTLSPEKLTPHAVSPQKPYSPETLAPEKPISPKHSKGLKKLSLPKKSSHEIAILSEIEKSAESTKISEHKQSIGTLLQNLANQEIEQNAQTSQKPSKNCKSACKNDEDIKYVMNEILTATSKTCDVVLNNCTTEFEFFDPEEVSSKEAIESLTMFTVPLIQHDNKFCVVSSCKLLRTDAEIAKEFELKEIAIALHALPVELVRIAMQQSILLRTIVMENKKAFYFGSMKLMEHLEYGEVKEEPRKSLIRAIDLLAQTARRSSPNKLSKQRKFVDESALKCPVCPKTYLPNDEMLELHLKFHCASDVRNLICPLCQKPGSSWQSLLRHYSTHEEGRIKLKELNIELSNKTSCAICGKIFSSHESVMIHLAKKHPPICEGQELHPCDVCNETFADLKAMKRHKEKHAEPMFKCLNCDYTTGTHYNYILHTSLECRNTKRVQITDPFDFGISEKVNKVHQSALTHYACLKCKNILPSLELLEEHMRKQHPVMPSTIVKSTKYRCDHCPMWFKNVNLLCAHLPTHQELTMFSCKLCDYSCKYKNVMTRHAKKMHPRHHLKQVVQNPNKKWMDLKKKIQADEAQAIKHEKLDLAKGTHEDGNDRSLSETDDEEEDGIPTATVVVSTDENGELTVCDAEDVSDYPLDAEIDIPETLLVDQNGMTIDGNMAYQLIQSGDNLVNGSQTNVVFVSMGGQELEVIENVDFTHTQTSS